jgi:cytidyltransferase-like protein
VKLREVLVFGAFDPLHEGHLDFFQQAKRWGGRLTVVVARDETISVRKGRPAHESEKVRLEKVKQTPSVDRALLGYPAKEYRDQLRIVKEISPDVICLGYDQKPSAARLQKLLSDYGLTGFAIKTLKPYHPEKFKSSLLRSRPPRS